MVSEAGLRRAFSWKTAVVTIIGAVFFIQLVDFLTARFGWLTRTVVWGGIGVLFLAALRALRKKHAARETPRIRWKVPWKALLLVSFLMATTLMLFDELLTERLDPMLLSWLRDLILCSFAIGFAWWAVPRMIQPPGGG